MPLIKKQTEITYQIQPHNKLNKLTKSFEIFIQQPSSTLKMTNKNLILFSGKLNERASGPSGYLAILQQGLLEIKSNTEILSNGTKITHATKNNIFTKIISAVKKWNQNRIKNRRNKNNAQIEEKIIKDISSPLPPYIITKIKNKDILTIHVHNIFDAHRLHLTLQKEGLEKTIILTTHTPESCAIETCNALQNLSKERKDEVFEFISKLEREAFSLADVLIFPSKEAMDPLYETIPGFNDIVQHKKIYFVPTGCKDLSTPLTTKVAKEKFNITNEFVVSFIGRHIAVKGYDILSEAAELLKNEHLNIRFIIAGHKQNLPLNLHEPYWTELGYIDPSILLKASDCFILPNRRTFYDLVLLEALSIGVPIIASRTGGNKTIMKNCPSVIGFDTKESPSANLAKKIKEVISASETTRAEIASKNKNYYINNHTPKIFAEHYEETIKEIHKTLFTTTD